MSLCGDEEIQELVAAMEADAPGELALADQLAMAWPADPRVHFLRGSLLVKLRRPIEAHAALTRAVALAPEFWLARFQLGFFELTSGEGDRALATLAPLEAQLPAEHYLALFASGLRHLICDRFAESAVALRAGIAGNAEVLPLNRDMQLIIDRCADLVPPPNTGGEEEASATSFLLDQFSSGTRH